MITSEKMYAVADRLGSLLQDGKDVRVDMSAVLSNPMQGRAGCVACCYGLACYIEERDRKLLQFSVAVDRMNKDLGLDLENGLDRWGMENKHLWGNGSGAVCYGAASAYGGKWGAVPLSQVVSHLTGVADRLAVAEGKEPRAKEEERKQEREASVPAVEVVAETAAAEFAKEVGIEITFDDGDKDKEPVPAEARSK